MTMRDLIKTIIAFVFIIVTFISGKYMASEKYSTIINEKDSIIQNDKEYLIKLKDSLAQFKYELDKIKNVLKTDTSKTLIPDKNKQSNNHK